MGELREVFPQEHRQGIGFLPGRARGRPDREFAQVGPLLEQARDNGFPQRLEGLEVAEEKCFVGRQRVDRLRMERAGGRTFLHQGDQLAEVFAALAVDERS